MSTESTSRTRRSPRRREPVPHRLTRDQVIWSFGPALEPVLEVEPGETVVFETNDCFTGQIRSEDDLVTEIDLERINGATGPVAVKGAEPGDSLVAEIVEVEPIEWGVATLIPGFGQLIDQVRSPLTRLFRVEDGVIRMNDRVSFPARPMVGVVGVATDDDYDDALKLVCEEAPRLLVDEHGFTIEDAFIFLSVACDAGVAQACKPAPGGFGTIARFSIPKLDATPQPFRS